jgi:hypothetical protein
VDTVSRRSLVSTDEWYKATSAGLHLVWASMRLRLAELIAAWSLATDLGLWLPQEHVLRQCRIASPAGGRPVVV